MNSLTGLTVILRIFNFFGLATFVAVKNPENPSDAPVEKLFDFSLMPLIQNLIFILAIGGTNYTSLRRNYWSNLMRCSIRDVVDPMFGSFVALAVLLYYFVRQRATFRLTFRIYKLYVASGRASTGRKGRSTFYVVASLLACQLALSAAAIVASFVNYAELTRMLSSVSWQLIVAWMVVQYALVVKVLGDVCANLNAAFEGLTKKPARSPGEKRTFLLSARNVELVLKVRSLHHSLMDACREVQGFYEVTILACTAYIFVFLLVSMYSVLGSVVEEEAVALEAIEYTHLGLAQISFVVSLLALTRHVTKVELESIKTGQIVHQLIRGTLSNEVTRELEEFSLYLLHTQVKFTAWGIFPLDGSLIKTLLGSITTYLVILLQLHPQPSTDKAFKETEITTTR